MKRLVDRSVKKSAGEPPPTLPAIEILILCTGNICRSPMAEALLRRRAEELAVPVSVSSAGLLLEHEPAEFYAVEAMDRLGLDLSRHRSRIVDRELVSTADLLIGMEPRHVREVSLLEPDAFDRTFAFPELVARAEAVGPRGSRAFDEWLVAVGEGRSRASALRGGPKLEVADPMGGSKRVFRRCADQLVDLVDRFAALAWSDEAASGHSDVASQPPPRSL